MTFQGPGDGCLSVVGSQTGGSSITCRTVSSLSLEVQVNEGTAKYELDIHVQLSFNEYLYPYGLWIEIN